MGREGEKCPFGTGRQVFKGTRLVLWPSRPFTSIVRGSLKRAERRFYRTHVACCMQLLQNFSAAVCLDIAGFRESVPGKEAFSPMQGAAVWKLSE